MIILGKPFSAKGHTHYFGLVRERYVLGKIK